MANVISNIKDFKKKFPNVSKEGPRIDALEKYFKIKGVIRAYDGQKEWPKLTYPTMFVINKKLDEIKKKKELYKSNLLAWTKKFKEAERYHQTNQIKKLKEPLYWKHLLKKSIDSDYRKDYNEVSLPVHLVGDEKWKPMVKMFVTDLEYRKQLSETVRESIIYKKDKKVAKYADDLKDFRMTTSEKQMKDIEKRLNALEELETALKEIQKWAKE